MTNNERDAIQGFRNGIGILLETHPQLAERAGRDNPEVARALAVVKTKLQEARMWTLEALFQADLTKPEVAAEKPAQSTESSESTEEPRQAGLME